MRKVSIGFSRPKNKKLPIFSWLIRAYERTPYSHVYIRWDTNLGPKLCYHAASLFVHFLGDDVFNEHIETVESFEFEISDENFANLMRFCIKNAGKEYGLLEVFGIPVMDLLKLSRNPFGDENKEYCAELVIRALTTLDSKLTFDADRVKLKEVYNFVSAKHASGAAL